VIRPATVADVDAIVRLEHDNLGVDAWSRALVPEGVAGHLPSVTYLVASDAEDVVGHAVVSVVADTSELQRIAVDVSHRRAGLATQLLDEVVVLAESAGADRLLLEVREDNDRAIAFYAARGFVEIDRRSRYYRDGGTAVVMLRTVGATRDGVS
jgi:ribosomal-protein-alanine N-acetyltransferase